MTINKLLHPLNANSILPFAHTRTIKDICKIFELNPLSDLGGFKIVQTGSTCIDKKGYKI